MSHVIRRKIDRARPSQADGAPGVDRCWRLALARAAREALGLDLGVDRLAITRAGLAEILDSAPDRALVALLDGPRGGLGALMLSPAVTAAFIEIQALGRLQSQPAPPRRPTRIDAAMVSGVIDKALAFLDEALAEEADFVWAGGFRYASWLEDVRPLALILEEEDYRVLTADVALGGNRTGQAILILPAIGRGDRPAWSSAEVEETAPQFTAALAAQVELADCRLDAVIGRARLTIGRIMALKPGDVLEMASATVDSISLETLDARGVARARLGQKRGMRAVKILSIGPQTSRPAPSPEQSVLPGAADAATEAEEEWRAAG
ncbi:FliM/FliN family flagellar motor switch protein [Tabrizicola sp. YIM 78059]|uniref:FliM/FliN family flagellar motor switch protein n=1 Tax=Tabrizicola sp. YIM 78059 TaxID=2529861 RepID=UPI0010AADC4D|nr:flagellar motor switch protein FliM [Tabrizicola sp. YIM 78059]